MSDTSGLPDPNPHDAQDHHHLTHPESPKHPESTTIPAAGGQVIIASTQERQISYQTLHYAPARHAGDLLYISGVLVRARPGEDDTVESFTHRVRRAFNTMETTLHAAGATFADVTLINSFHVWHHPQLRADKATHIETFATVKDEFVHQPYPAWTAIGVAELIEDGNIEIQLTAHLPAR